MTLVDKALDVSQIKLMVLDVDGTLTDGGIYLTESGEEFKKYNTKDGMAIKRLLRQGMHVAFISASKSVRSVTRRAEMLGVEYCYVGDDPKPTVLEKWLADLDLTYQQVLFMGDDINDLEVMQRAGIAVCPADASPAVIRIADLVLSRSGGQACFRELVDRYFPLL